MKIRMLIIQDDDDVQVQAYGMPFSVDLEPSLHVENLKEKVKQKAKNYLGHLDIMEFCVWKTEDEMILSKKDWKEMLKSINFNDLDTIRQLEDEENVENLGLTDNEILLVQKLPGVPRGTAISDGVSEAKDKVPEMSKEFKCYKDTLANSGLSPSMAAKSIEYFASQGDITQVIYDGRRGLNNATIGPPIQIFHPIFDDFTRMVSDPDVQPTVQDLTNVHELMYDAGELRPEHPYRERLRLLLGRILGTRISVDPLPDRSQPDGVVTLEVCNTLLPYMILEVKREMGESGCDPTTQAGLYMRRSWVHESRQGVRERSCGPTFLVAAGGPWLCVLGSVFTDKIIVQRLTDMRWMALSSMEEDNRIYHNARVLIALRECLKTLRIYYENLNDSKFTPIVNGETHPRFYPYPTSFTDRTQKTDVHFKYVRSLEDNPICVTYLAEIIDKDGAATGDHVVVKFVASYGEKVHEFLAHQGWAPTLRYCGPLCEETGLSDDFPGPAQSAPPGLHLHSNMRMVVMDYIDALPWKEVPQDAREQIREVLTALHTNGYVFGDLRPPNLLFDKDKKVKLIDFDWSGRYDTKDSNNLVDGLQEQIDGNMDRAEVGDGPYAHYPLGMSTIRDMWAPGMTPLTPIRPQHDRMMVDKLPYC